MPRGPQFPNIVLEYNHRHQRYPRLMLQHIARKMLYEGVDPKIVIQFAKTGQQLNDAAILSHCNQYVKIIDAREEIS